MVYYQLKESLNTYQPPKAAPWRTGFWCRLPLAGISAIILAIASSFAMFQILTMSNGQPFNSWTYQPTVYLSISYTIANISLQFALSQAITIAWWVKALKSNVKIRDLHNIWAFGSGIKSILCSGRAFNLIALAGLAVTLVPINGPLLQRATAVSTQIRTSMKQVTIPITQEHMFSGWNSDRKHVSTKLYPPFASILYQQKTGQSINMTSPSSGCQGRCKGLVRGIGYDMTCINDTVPFNFTLPKTERPTVFSTNFTFDELHNGTWTFMAVFLNETFDRYAGYFARRNCTMRPAIIEHPVIVANGTIALDPDGSWITDRTERLSPTAGIWDEGLSVHGGFFLYSNMAYNSNCYFHYDGAKAKVQVETVGSTVFDYENPQSYRADAWGSTWRDPTFDILSVLREIVFRTALLAGSSEDETERLQWAQRRAQQVDMEQTTTELVYQSNFLFLGIAVAITVFATFTVLVVSSGWWNLGRDVSLSPIEIAKAFAAPSLADADSNATVKVLLKEVGNRKIR